MAGKKGMKIPSRSVSRARKERLTENWKEHIQATAIMNRLKDHGDGKLEKPLDSTQIKAYEVLLSRLVPALSAVEQTTIDVTPAETDLAATIRSVLKSNPELRPMFLALIQDNPDVKPDDHGIH